MYIYVLFTLIFLQTICLKAYFGGKGRRYYVKHCATLGDIGNFQRKVVRVAGRNWATLGDIKQIDC